MSKFNIYRIGKESSQYEIFKNDRLGEGSYSSVCLGRSISTGSVGPPIFSTLTSPSTQSTTQYTTQSTTQPIPIGITENQGGHLVAIKKIIKSTLSTRGLSMLTSEIEIIKEMITHNHNNIVKCYDVIDDIDVIYIIMEYCVNGDFSSLLNKKQMKYDFIKYYFGQIVNALKYLNDNNIIHRDIKPKNILVTNGYKTIKLCDFGFARHSTGIKRIMTMCGSPLYMAPEIYQKIGYSQSVDVWSLGLILYEMLFGYHPLEHCIDPKKIAQSVINDDITIPFRSDVDDRPIELLKLMLKRTEKDRININEIFQNEWINECMKMEITNEMSNSISKLNIYENSSLLSSQYTSFSETTNSENTASTETNNVTDVAMNSSYDEQKTTINKQILSISSSVSEREFNCTFTMDD